jgi:hypothetical protein
MSAPTHDREGAAMMAYPDLELAWLRLRLQVAVVDAERTRLEMRRLEAAMDASRADRRLCRWADAATAQPWAWGQP